MLGMKPERGSAGMTAEMREKMRPSGADEVRGQLVLEAIADKENLAVTDEELAAHIEATAKQRNVAPAKLRAEWQKDGRIENVTYSLRQDKVLKYLVDKATVTEVEKLTQQGTPLPGSMPTSGIEPGHETHSHTHGQPGHVHGPECEHE